MDNRLVIKICSYRAAQRYTARRMIQAALPAILETQPGLEVEIVEIRDVQEILQYTPVIIHISLVINDRLVCTGRSPKKEEITAWLLAEADKLKTASLSPIRTTVE
ncbi:MAG TPA: thioredoxin family protein [Anaerolineaceae bacterium]|nr:thioredoxin family protein [Anaerolineaceae bacterium]